MRRDVDHDAPVGGGRRCRPRSGAATPCVAINLLVGERAGIDDSLGFYFELLTADTLAEGARLSIRRTPMRFHCAVCESDSRPRGGDFRCPRCVAIGRLTDDGSHLMIESIEIET